MNENNELMNDKKECSFLENEVDDECLLYEDGTCRDGCPFEQQICNGINVSVVLDSVLGNTSTPSRYRHHSDNQN